MGEESSLDKEREENTFWAWLVYIHWGLKELQKLKQLSPFQFQFHDLKWCLEFSSFIQILIWMHYDFFSTYKGYGHLSCFPLQIWDKNPSVINSLHLHMKNILPLIKTQFSPYLSQLEAWLLSLHMAPCFHLVSYNTVCSASCHTLKLFRKREKGKTIS